MHELSLTTSMVSIVSKETKGRPVRRVVLELGELTCVMEATLRFAFDVCVKGTALDGATLEIEPVAGRARCKDCGEELAVSEPYGRCECGSFDLEILAGEELRIREVEVM